MRNYVTSIRDERWDRTGGTAVRDPLSLLRHALDFRITTVQRRPTSSALSGFNLKYNLKFPDHRLEARDAGREGGAV